MSVIGTPITTPAASLPSYLTVSEALSLAEEMLPLTSFSAASSTNQQLALAVATRDVDRAFRYQGRKFDLSQTLEFPRQAYHGSGYPGSWAFAGDPCLPGSTVNPQDVWDWDAVNNVAIVPQNVKLATLYQADFALGKGRSQLLNKALGGKTSVKVGSAAETYDLAAIMRATGGVLCPDAARIMSYYLIRQGRMI